MIKRITRRRNRWLAAAGALALAGIVGCVRGAVRLGQSDAQQARSAFVLASDQVAANLKLAIQHEDDLLVGGATFLLENPNASNAQFRRWAGMERVLERYPELLGIRKIVFVTAAQLGTFGARAGADPVERSLARRSFTILPPGKRAYYCLTSVGLDRSPQVAPPAGVDYCNADIGLTAQRDSGAESAYAVSLARGLPPALGIQIPLYRGGATPSSIAARRSAFVGWVGMGVTPTVLLREALQGQPNTVAILRRATTGGGTVPTAASAAPTFASGRIPRGAQRVVTDLQDGSSVQTFKVLGGASVFSNGDSLVLLLGGVLMSVLLAVFVFVLGTGRARARRLVGEKTGQLSFQALHDSLTGLPNRALVIDRTEQLLARARRRQSPVAALFMDVDGFKQVNDTFGHAAGDELLRVVAARLSGVVRGSDTVGRLGGDEFVALLEGDSLYAGPELVAERVLEVLRQPIELEASKGRSLSISASIGIAVGQRANADELLRDADLALYQAKQAGKDRLVLFEERMHIAAADRRALEMDLARALEHEQLFLLYQPTFDLQTRLVTGVEALIRWRHPTRGVVPPDAFIPLAEETAMIVPMGRWVLRTACYQAAAWRLAGHLIGMSVNVSARQLERDQFVTEVREALEQSGLDPGALTLEITETVLMRDADAAAGRLRALKALGVRIAIDDFGTGYCSLAYLRTFPIDALKIDRSFISGISSSQESAALMRTLVQLGKTLQLETLGEGIEDEDQLQQLQREHCDSGQGFLFARPLRVEQVEWFLEREHPAVPATHT